MVYIMTLYHGGMGMAEAACEVAVVCYQDAASIHINAQGFCTCLQVFFKR